MSSIAERKISRLEALCQDAEMRAAVNYFVARYGGEWDTTYYQLRAILDEAAALEQELGSLDAVRQRYAQQHGCTVEEFKATERETSARIRDFGR